MGAYGTDNSISDTSGCCPDGGEYKRNPKKGFRSTSKRFASFSYGDSPIPAQIRDGGEFKKFFAAYKDVFVPYSGTDEFSSHSLQSFVISLTQLSQTQGAILRSMRSHAFGGKVDIVKRFDPVFEIEQNDEVSNSEKLKFYEFVKELGFYGLGESKFNIRQFAMSNFDDTKSNGNYYFELVRSEVNGQKSFKIFAHNPTDCLYLATEIGEPRFISISPIWSRDYITRNPPRTLPLYPNWVNEDGVERTIVHIKNGNFEWYGRPDSMSSLLYQFFEFQNADYLNKQTAANFMGQAFIEVEDDNPEFSMTGEGDELAQKDHFEGLAEQFEENYTNKGSNPQSVILSSRPYGSKEAFVFQFTPNTNEKWFRVTAEIAQQAIIKSHGWSKRFLGMDASTGLSTNVYLDEFEIQSVTNIREAQEFIGNPINNIILKEAIEFYGRDDLKDYSIEFKSPFATMLTERKENESNDRNRLGNSQE